jgi:hypothetical protein
MEEQFGKKPEKKRWAKSTVGPHGRMHTGSNPVNVRNTRRMSSVTSTSNIIWKVLVW